MPDGPPRLYDEVGFANSYAPSPWNCSTKPAAWSWGMPAAYTWYFDERPFDAVNGWKVRSE
ncbi:hypothetical protein C7T36_16780 [Rhodococcus sp. AD45-ID]|nr:hypothetical protein C7T36_16780 [Rhodococcus sp. AD45-ID]